jgi:coproporphyrinogen III oxidase
MKFSDRSDQIVLFLKQLQNEICEALELTDGVARFKTDEWNRQEGGGGITKIISDGKVFEKGGVNFSAVHGVVPAFLKKEIVQDFKCEKEPSNFLATGVSIVIHPVNPMVPIIHMNIRYFETDNGIYWFGGGIDLTPHYVLEEDAKFFHSQLKSVCDIFDNSFYPEFKKWCDDYFYIKHRQETRGVGGIFFDKIFENEKHSFDLLFAFWKSVGNTFAPTYTSLCEKNKNIPYNERQKKWQSIRRGRYVEFNLVYDKGTKFGLETNGRIESILMSLPKTAGWEYNFIPEQNSQEARTLSYLIKGINWL